jgi:caffeoyl-CoA O-methyltransferase
MEAAMRTGLFGMTAVVLSGFALLATVSRPLTAGQDLDRRVQAFLAAHAGRWQDLNVPKADGRTLYDIIVKNRYTRALEIGTSTGHSGIWIAWALSKTGGRLVTVEIDKARRDEAVANFREAGLDGFIDARLGDAHDLVPALPGPFDLVFCDADKDWYKNYFADVLPKLEIGGAFVAHNVSLRMKGGRWGAASFVDYVLSLPFMETTFVEGSRAGMSVSYKRAEREPPGPGRPTIS